MGLHPSQLTPEIYARMAPGDQKRYAAQAPSVSPKANRLEREEQRTFANWCLQQDLAFVWHSTAHATKASVGCPDFVVQIAGHTLWIEFKGQRGRLSPEQEEFRGRLVRQAALYFVVESAAEAIDLAKKYQYHASK